jgi:hypothetical protein
MILSDITSDFCTTATCVIFNIQRPSYRIYKYVCDITPCKILPV